jgi:hypothetical protein
MKIICPELYLLDKDDYYNFDADQTQWHEYVNDTGLETEKYEGEYESIGLHLKCFNNKITSSIPFLKLNRNFGDFNLLFGIERDKKNLKLILSYVLVD